MRSATIALLAVLSIVSPALAALRLPRRNTWRGTITTTAGLTGTFIVRTRLIEARDIETEFGGRFRCRGPGCPMRHGRVDFFSNLAPDRIDEILFGARRPTNINCAYVNNEPPPNFGIGGDYTCYTTVPPEPPPVRLFSQGTLNLVPSRIPQLK